MSNNDAVRVFAGRIGYFADGSLYLGVVSMDTGKSYKLGIEMADKGGISLGDFFTTQLSTERNVTEFKLQTTRYKTKIEREFAHIENLSAELIYNEQRQRVFKTKDFGLVTCTDHSLELGNYLISIKVTTSDEKVQHQSRLPFLGTVEKKLADFEMLSSRFGDMSMASEAPDLRTSEDFQRELEKWKEMTLPSPLTSARSNPNLSPQRPHTAFGQARIMKALVDDFNTRNGSTLYYLWVCDIAQKATLLSNEVELAKGDFFEGVFQTINDRLRCTQYLRNIPALMEVWVNERDRLMLTSTVISYHATGDKYPYVIAEYIGKVMDHLPRLPSNCEGMRIVIRRIKLDGVNQWAVLRLAA